MPHNKTEECDLALQARATYLYVHSRSEKGMACRKPSLDVE
jgi:hypothetical protein